MVVSPRLNSAAEFVENRIESSLRMEISATSQAASVPELDRFESQDGITDVDYYAESKKRINLFKETLERFSQTLDKHDLTTKIDITLKGPSEHNLKDVIRIAGKVYERHKTAADVKICTTKILRCFRFDGKSASPLQYLLNFVPNESYVSAISGGFTVILAAAERVESRESIYAALEAITEKLRLVKALSDIQYRSANLNLAADSVFVCLFKVLDRIVEELTQNIAKKGPKAVMEGKPYGNETDESLKDLGKALRNFKQEARICSNERLARLEQHILLVKQSLDRLEANQKQTSILDALKPKTRRTRESGKKSGHTANLDVLNTILRLLTSSEAFDYLTEKGRRPDYLLVKDNDKPELVSSRQAEPSSRLNKKALKKWSTRLPLDFVAAAESDMRELLRHNLPRTQQDQVQYIMTSEELLSWLEKPESGMLVIQCEAPPDTTANAISLSSAFLAQNLGQNHHGPVLYHSCGLRTEEGRRKAERSGPIAVINSLNSQLATQLRKHADLSFLGTEKYRDKSQARLRPALKLLRRLLDEIPEDESVFVIIDSLCRLSGDSEDEVEAIRGISRVAEHHADKGQQPTVKVLMTDLLPGHLRRGVSKCGRLYVPDRVSGGGQGLNSEYLREVCEASIGRFEARRRGGGSAGGHGRSVEDPAGSDGGFGDSDEDSGSSGGDSGDVSEQSESSDSEMNISHDVIE